MTSSPTAGHEPALDDLDATTRDPVATGAAQDAAPARGRLGRGLGVVLVQALNSVTTVVQMALFAIVLPRGAFDDYAVWFTSAMFVIGLGQAIGTERVVIGKRTAADGTRSARVLAIVIALVQLAISLALGNPTLVICSLAMFTFVTYDFQRFARCFDEAGRFLRRDLFVLGLQIVAVVVPWLVVGDSSWLVLGWWAVAAPLWFAFSGHESGGLLSGLRVLRDDARECVPLLLDASLAGVPLVVALALVRAQGAEGDASAARMAFTILGPITVLGMSARRIAYQAAAKGPIHARFAVIWAGVCGGTLVGCALLLSLTRTPLYPWVFPGFVGLSWVAILGFATNHASLFSTLLPAASLRAERRSFEVGVSRVIATVGAGVAMLFMLPFDSAAKVGWSVAIGSILYSLCLYGTRALPRRGRDATPAAPVAAGPAEAVG